MNVSMERIWRSMPAAWAKEIASRGYIRSKYLMTKSRFWIDDAKVNSWANSRNIFFVLSIGRSGTKFLAYLLNQASRCHVAHEPILSEARAHQSAFLRPETAAKYVAFRKREIFARTRRLHIDTYGEVNSYLRRHAVELQTGFPKARFLHVVRDGRAFVRSAMSRSTMKPWAPDTFWIYRSLKDRGSKESGESPKGRFERLCWYWKVENAFLREAITEWARFEDLVSHYGYFDKWCSGHLGVRIEEHTWDAARRRKRNVTKTYSIPKWDEWPSSMQESFARICGEEMVEYGYKL